MGISKFKYILLNNITLALIISLPFIYYAGYFIDKYTLEIEGPINMNMYKSLFYNDLNNDGNSDKIYFGENRLGNVYCKIYDPVHRGQFNTSGKFLDYPTAPYFADINGDGINEIIFLTQKDTAFVYLNIVNYVEDKKEEIKICEVGKPGKRDFGAAFWGFLDLDRNGQKEILITIGAGFALQPRAIYSVNPKNWEVKRTPEIGSKLGDHIIEDIDNDGYIEIVCGTFTSQNYHTSLNFPYDDNWSRIFVFDHNLQFKFPPLKFSNKRSYIRTNIRNVDGAKMIYAHIDFRGDTLNPNQQFLINAQGEIEKKEFFIEGNLFINKVPQVFQNEGNLMTIDENGILFQIDSELKFHKKKKLTEYKACSIRKLDIDNDGINEHLLVNAETGEITIADKQLKHPTSFFVPGNYVYWLTPILKKGEGNKYLIRNNKGHFVIKYAQNPYWNFRFLLLALIIGIIYLLLTLLNKIQSYKLKEKLRAERELHELQYRAITSQFSPHYTFNVLNTLSSQVYDKEKPELYDYFNKFIRQLRYLYEDKNAVTRSLKEEISFCRDYLDIQLMRFPEKFEYEVKTSFPKFETLEKVADKIQIPKMMLHTFVENAFKHGLRPYEEGGSITIAIAGGLPTKVRVTTKKKERMPSLSLSTQKDGILNQNRIQITITDNGIGRAAAKAYAKQNPQFSSGRGLEMLHEFVALYNKGKKEKIEIETVDLFNAEKDSGTEVQITIPM